MCPANFNKPSSHTSTIDRVSYYRFEETNSNSLLTITHFKMYSRQQITDNKRDKLISKQQNTRITTESDDIYTYKRVVGVCLSVGLFVCFLSATRHLSTLRRCLRVAERAGEVAGSPARTWASMHSESTRAHAVQLLNEKIVR